ncbi:MAG: alanine--tRNA ligase [Chloroflexi bacterium]|nr:alanine--tRNA ligase [Chloroflexota bacterium]
MWDSRKIRDSFLMFFEAKDHLLLPSFPLIPNNDPTLLLIGAGMAPFKPMFKGDVPPPAPRVTTCQKCVRVGDIERVGKTSRHHTFFEMLGNFSFGDYYKKETCQWAWEYLTTIMKLDPERLWISIHPEDDEAETIWKNIGIPEEKIFREETNFWGPVGDSGPCGPCSELIYDRGEKYACGPNCKPGCDCDRYIEIWNLVFTGLFKDENGRISNLGKQCIDTGLGFERLVMVMQDKPSPYETELFMPIIKSLREIADINASGEITSVAERVIADHLRSLVFMASDGIFPSNEGRGYVFRRLLRNALKIGRDLGTEEEFLYRLAPVVIENYSDIYPELEDRREYTVKVIKQEETGFLKTLDSGMEIFESIVEHCKQHNESRITGEDVFRLYDTFGFPVELSREMAEEAGLEINEEGFKKEMESQREKGRKSIVRDLAIDFDDSVAVFFNGYKKDSDLDKGLDVELAFINQDKNNKEPGAEIEELKEGESGLVIINPTPFYAESGGQVGDTGEIRDESGDNVASVEDTFNIGNYHVSRVRMIKGSLKKGLRYRAFVDTRRRREIRRHHTATHLLHWALRKVLGTHVKQAGSYVGPYHLRFDFTHFKELTDEEIHEVAELVNTEILESHPITVDVVPMSKALQEGAMALFGEKYGETVRMVSVGDGFSRELCGGTHLEYTGQVGNFIILSETAVGRGLRRIEAVCGFAGLRYLYAIRDAVTESCQILKSKPDNLPQSIRRLKETLREKENMIEQMEKKLSEENAGDFLKEAKDIEGVKVLSKIVSGYTSRALRELGDNLKEGLKSGALFLGQESDGKAVLLFMVTPDLIKKGISAGKLIAAAAEVVDGKGGGKPDFAQAGGKDPSKLSLALKKAEEQLKLELSDKRLEKTRWECLEVD